MSLNRDWKSKERWPFPASAGPGNLRESGFARGRSGNVEGRGIVGAVPRASNFRYDVARGENVFICSGKVSLLPTIPAVYTDALAGSASKWTAMFSAVAAARNRRLRFSRLDVGQPTIKRRRKSVSVDEAGRLFHN